MPVALYLHVPFCPRICPYCDFHKMRRDERLVEAYLARLEEEALELHGEHPSLHPDGLDTIYFGGGTPSHLGDDELGRVVRSLERTWGWPARLETTIEADPLTFDPERLARLRDLGFDRVSIGLQSTQDDVLRRLGRLHDGAAGLQAVRWALEAGFRVSADLITAVPGQDVERDLHALAATGVGHVSVYTLTIEPFTPFARRGVRVDPEREADDYAVTNEILSGYGLGRYEVSSHARPGEESRHNAVYWSGEHFLALGPSAASFLPRPGTLGVRRVNGPIKRWLFGEGAEETRVGPLEYVEDCLMTGLRTRAGVDEARLERLVGAEVWRAYAPLVRRFEDAALLARDGGRLRATDAGLWRLDGVIRAVYDAREGIESMLRRDVRRGGEAGSPADVGS